MFRRKRRRVTSSFDKIREYWFTDRESRWIHGPETVTSLFSWKPGWGVNDDVTRAAGARGDGTEGRCTQRAASGVHLCNDVTASFSSRCRRCLPRSFGNSIFKNITFPMKRCFPTFLSNFSPCKILCKEKDRRILFRLFRFSKFVKYYYYYHIYAKICDGKNIHNTCIRWYSGIKTFFTILRNEILICNKFRFLYLRMIDL